MCRLAACRYSECRYTEYRYSEFHYVECRYAMCHNAKCSDIIFSTTEALTGLGVKSPNTQQLQQIVYIRCHPAK